MQHAGETVAPNAEVDGGMDAVRSSKSGGDVQRSRSHSVWRILRSAVIAYLCGLTVLMFIERWLIYPIPDPALGNWKPAGLAYEDVWLEADDGIRLHGWYLPSDGAKHAVLFFHGNGEDVSWCGPALADWGRQAGVSVLAMSYRGYGKSGGKPGEAAMVRDGILAAHWLSDRTGLDAKQLVLWGRSIGGGVAAGVAKEIAPQALIMECTFDSLANVAAVHVRWAPVRWLMSNQFRSADHLKDYQGQYLQWHGDADTIVPLVSAERLFQAVGTRHKTFLLGEGRGHNDEPPAKFYQAVRDLFRRLGDADTARPISPP
ncbi:MAG: alpha/beta hydrolase [Planctomycetaceae bacterium]